jgi:hypothetical protein
MTEIAEPTPIADTFCQDVALMERLGPCTRLTFTVDRDAGNDTPWRAVVAARDSGRCDWPCVLRPGASQPVLARRQPRLNALELLRVLDHDQFDSQGAEERAEADVPQYFHRAGTK